MNHYAIIEAFDINAERYRTAKTLIDRKLYLDIIDLLLDEWLDSTEQSTQEFEPTPASA
jgi:hypothetical protein